MNCLLRSSNQAGLNAGISRDLSQWSEELSLEDIFDFTYCNTTSDVATSVESECDSSRSSGSPVGNNETTPIGYSNPNIFPLSRNSRQQFADEYQILRKVSSVHKNSDEIPAEASNKTGRNFRPKFIRHREREWNIGLSLDEDEALGDVSDVKVPESKRSDIVPTGFLKEAPTLDEEDELMFEMEL